MNLKEIMNSYIKPVEKFYSKDVKMYHTIYHVEKLFKLYNQYRDEFFNEFSDLNENALFEAIAYHDCVYIVGSPTNEEESAELYLKNCKFPKKHVYNAIISTKIGNETFSNNLEKVIHDLDWSSFAQDYKYFKSDADKIVYEASYNNIYPKNIVYKNQKNFMNYIFLKIFI